MIQKNISRREAVVIQIWGENIENILQRSLIRKIRIRKPCRTMAQTQGYVIQVKRKNLSTGRKRQNLKTLYEWANNGKIIVSQFLNTGFHIFMLTTMVYYCKLKI